jgi:hypothetical protein
VGRPDPPQVRVARQGDGAAAATIRVAAPAGRHRAREVPADVGAERLGQPLHGEGDYGLWPRGLQLGGEAAAQVADGEVAAEGADLEPDRLQGAVLEAEVAAVRPVEHVPVEGERHHIRPADRHRGQRVAAGSGGSKAMRRPAASTAVEAVTIAARARRVPRGVSTTTPSRPPQRTRSAGVSGSTGTFAPQRATSAP